MAHTERIPQIGDVYFVEFSGSESVQNGIRPGLVFQNNIGNTHSPNVIVLPLTSSIKKLGQPTHVLLRASETGLPRDSVVLCENPECIPKKRLGRYITTLSDLDVKRVAEANLLVSAAIAFLDIEAIKRVKYTASRLNGKMG